MKLATESKNAAAFSPTSTPILDVLRPLPRGERWKLSAGEIFFLSSALILALLILPGNGSQLLNSGQPGSWLLALTAGLGLLILAAAVHELGHFMAARLAGFRRLQASAAAGSFDQRLHGSEIIPFRLFALRPAKMEYLRSRLFLISAAGPTANLLFPIVLAKMPIRGPVWIANCTHFLSGCSLLLGIASLLPDLTRGGNFSDGARLIMLLKNDARAARWLSIHYMQSAWNAGRHPSDWDQLWIVRATSSDDDSRDAVNAKWLAYIWAAERQDITAATPFLEGILAAPFPVLRRLRNRVFLEAAIFQAWFRENQTLAHLWAQRIRSRRMSEFQRRRLQIALLWVDGKLYDAQEALAAYLKAFENLPPSQTYALAESSATEWKRQMESRMLTRAWRSIYSMSQQVESIVAAMEASK
jgi:hypothetical protein